VGIGFMPIYHHLTEALKIMATEPSYKKWDPLIDKLDEPAQSECRLWLRQEALKRNYWNAYRLEGK
jgi:hypothetical protein